MKKLSEAEKRRRKEKDIIDRATHILNILWACRDETMYNSLTSWKRKDISKYLELWDGFQQGVVLGDGRKWYNRLEKLWRDYAAIHGDLTKYP